LHTTITSVKVLSDNFYRWRKVVDFLIGKGYIICMNYDDFEVQISVRSGVLTGVFFSRPQHIGVATKKHTTGGAK